MDDAIEKFRKFFFQFFNGIQSIILQCKFPSVARRHSFISRAMHISSLRTRLDSQLREYSEIYPSSLSILLAFMEMLKREIPSS